MAHRKSTAVLEKMPESTNQPAKPVKVGFVSLGCPKNLVDSEVMMGMLAQSGARLISRVEDADVIVVNTCSFINTAQQESVDTILDMARHKTEGRAQKLVVAGCLVERYRDEIQKNIPEVDAVVGTGELEKILSAAGISQPPVSDSPFRILNSRAEGDARAALAASRATRGMEPSPISLIICTTKPRRGFSPRPDTRPTSRLPKAATILAVFALFRSCAANFARAVSNL